MTISQARKLHPGDHVIYKRGKRSNHGQVVFAEHNLVDIDWDDNSNTTVDLGLGDDILDHIYLKMSEAEYRAQHVLVVPVNR